MASTWITTRRLSSGELRYRVKYRFGGRESKDYHAGSFKTEAEALIRKEWITSELAAMRLPDITKYTPPAREQEPELIADYILTGKRPKANHG